MTQNSPHAGGRTGGVITRRKWLRRLILVAPLGLVLGGVLVFWGRGEPRAAINATLFTSNSGWWPLMSGDLANSVETVVADHVVNHIWEHTYLLWFDDKLTPHLPPSKPPSAADLAAAKWGVGGQGVGLRDGKVGSGNDRNPDSRTAVGIDPSRKLLFLAVGQNISPRLMLSRGQGRNAA
jgi:hypothetical protein